ncbi:3-oxoacyl-ACP synthase, partial [Streptomyces sp. NPDC005877]
ADAGAGAADVVHVNAHATATLEGDRAEARALGRVLGAHTPDVPVTANKGALGHLQGGAGGVEAIAAVLTLRDGLIPPTAGCDDVEDGIDLDVVHGSPRSLPLDGDIALSDSFGFGGHNAVLAFRSTG